MLYKIVTSIPRVTGVRGENSMGFTLVPLIHSDLSYAPLADDEDAPTESGKYSESPFSFAGDTNESINNSTGALAYEDKIAVIPGRGGLNLDLAIQYSSDRASSKRADILPGYRDVFESYCIFKHNYEGFSGSYPTYYDDIHRIYWTAWPDSPSKVANYSSIYWKEGKIKNKPMVFFGPISAVSNRFDFKSYTTMYNYWRANYSKMWNYLDKLNPYVWGSEPYEHRFSYIEDYYNTLRSVSQKTPFEYMGDGWSFNFSRVFKESENTYLRLSNGATYEYSEKANTSNLRNYPGRDIVFTTDPNSSQYPGSKYVLTYAGGRKEYFDVNGQIIGISDRFGNTIKFQYNNTGTYTGSIVITDTNEQDTTITYSAQEVIVHLPDGNEVTYDLTSSNGSKTLTRKTDQLGRETNFSYTSSPAVYNYLSRSANDAVTVNENLLTGITYPTGAASSYTYAKENGALGTKGWFEYYRVTSRQDKDDNVVYNHRDYTYNGNYTGYPNNASNSAELPAGYTYSTTVAFANNTSVTYTFNNKHLPTNVATFASGVKKQEEVFTYDANKHPASHTKTYFNGAVSRTAKELFEYDAYGNLTGYWDAQAGGSQNADHKTTSTYGADYSLLQTQTYKTNANTTVKLENTLSADKKTVSSSRIYVNNVLSERTDFTYDAYGNVLTATRYINPDQAVTTAFEYDGGVYLTSESAGDVTKTYGYDVYGRLLSATDGNGNETQYTYDEVGRPLSVTNPDGTSSKISYNDELRTAEATNEIGNIKKTSYNRMGFPVTVQDISGAAVTLSSYTYDNMGRLSTEADSKNTVTAYQYDYTGRITSKAAGANGSLYKETYAYNDAFSSTQSKATKTVEGDANAPSIITVAYENLYGFTEKSGYVINGQEIHDTFTYDYTGSAITSKTPNNHLTSYEYDGLKRLTKTTNPDGSVYQSAYDWLGRKISATDPKGGKSEYAYDALGRLTEEKIPFTGTYYTVKKYEYDDNGNTTRAFASNDKPGEAESFGRTDYAYNNRNFLTRVTSYDNDAAASYVDYEYDAAGNVTKMKTANGTQITAYEYDKQGRKTKLTDALNQSETYSYDTNGNMTGKTDRNGITTVHTYDLLNRIIKTKAGTAPDVTYAYAKTGAVLTEQNENTTVSREYDAGGRLIKETESGGIEKQYTYDLAGNRKSFKLLQNGAVKQNIAYDYDGLNRLTKVYENGTVIAMYGYDSNGNRESLTYANGITATYAYNKANMVTSLNNKLGTSTVSAYSYTYYLDGNQETKTDNTGKITTYLYDGFGRLKSEAETGVAASITRAYTYDTAGNRATMTVTGAETYTKSYSYDANNRLLTETTTIDGAASTAQYAYDANGNQVSRTENSVTETNGYDVFNRLTSAVKDGVTATYAYKPDGLRLSKTVNGTKTTHIWNGSNIALDLDGSNAVIDNYIRGIGLIKSQNNDYYIYNAHGDVTKLTDGTGAVIKSYEYDAFGVEQEKDASDVNPFRYCGEYWDIEIGTVYLRARYYSPLTARFLTEDSFRGNSKDPLSLNLYTYAHNNPIRYTDPSGHSVFGIIGSVVLKALESAVSFQTSAAKGNSNNWATYNSYTTSYTPVDNYQYNSTLSFSGFIYDQYSGNAAKLKIGKYTGDYNGCGIVATYNALEILGNSAHPADIIEYFETHNGLPLQGVFGTRTIAIYNYLDSLGLYQLTYNDLQPSSLDKMIESSTVSILRIGYSDTLSEHYIAIQYVGFDNNPAYRVYNEGNIWNAASSSVYPSIDKCMIEKKLSFWNLITIKQGCSMRKLLLLCFFNVLIITSCMGAVTDASPVPLGLWKSDVPDLTLNFDSDEIGVYHGVYVVNGSSHAVVAFKHGVVDMIEIYDANVYDFSTKRFTTSFAHPLFNGTWKLSKGKLRYKLYDSVTVEKKTIKTIIFENIIDEVSPNEIFGEILDESSEGGDVHSEKE